MSCRDFRVPGHICTRNIVWLKTMNQQLIKPVILCFFVRKRALAIEFKGPKNLASHVATAYGFNEHS